MERIVWFGLVLLLFASCGTGRYGGYQSHYYEESAIKQKSGAASGDLKSESAGTTEQNDTGVTYSVRTGPKGGKYYVNENGKKVYVSRDTGSTYKTKYTKGKKSSYKSSKKSYKSSSKGYKSRRK